MPILSHPVRRVSQGMHEDTAGGTRPMAFLSVLLNEAVQEK